VFLHLLLRLEILQELLDIAMETYPHPLKNHLPNQHPHTEFFACMTCFSSISREIADQSAPFFCFIDGHIESHAQNIVLAAS
jgi:hypothetical protein